MSFAQRNRILDTFRLMKIKIFISIFFLTAFVCGQENSKIDSLKRKSKKSVGPREKYETLVLIFENSLYQNLDTAGVYRKQIHHLVEKNPEFEISFHSLSAKYYYFKFELDSALYHTNLILDIAQKEGNDSLISDSYRRIAILQSRKGNLEEAVITGKLALNSANKSGNWELVASANTMVANQLYKKDNYDEALIHYLIADSIYKANNERSRNVALIYDNIGNIYINFKDAKALDYINESEAIYSALDDGEGIAYTQNLRGTFFKNNKEYRKSIEEFLKSADFYENYGNDYSKNTVYVKLLNVYSALGEYKKAENYLNKSEALINNTSSVDMKFETYLSAIQSFLDQGKNKRALGYLKKTEELLSNKKGSLYLHTAKGVSEGFTKAYEGLGRYDLALRYSKKWKGLNDSINSLNNLELSKNLEAKYQAEEKEKEIALLEAEMKAVEIQKSNQRKLFIAGLGVFSIAGFFLFFTLRNRQRTNKKLKELDRLKSNFFANISHEFRTPLTLISTPIEKRLASEKLNKADRSEFEMIQRNSNRLLSLVDQLLDLSKLESGNLKLRVSKGDLSPLLRSITSSFQYLAEQKGVKYSVKVDDLKNVWFDKNVVEKVVINLLSNAFKYTPDNGHISFAAAIKNGRLVVNVENTGTALSKEEVEQIFNRFYQADENADGVGIGLSLVKELVTLSHGEISVENTSNKKILLKVILPIAESDFNPDELVRFKPIDASLTDYEPNAVLAHDRKKIDLEIDVDQPILLIVEDDPDIRDLVFQSFSNSFQILEAENGKIGIEKAMKFVPDIIISDVMMPETNGLELCQQLKLDERTCHIPIVLLTAKADEEDQFKGLETGADDYVKKPFRLKLLQTRVQNLVTSRKLLRDRYSQEVILKPKDIAITNLDERFLQRIQAVLDKKMTEPSLSVEEFSVLIGMSRMQLHRKLKSLLGLSATEFIRNERLKSAAELLKTTNISIAEAAYSTGFNEVTYFSKCFKKTYGVSPSTFRKNS